MISINIFIQTFNYFNFNPRVILQGKPRINYTTPPKIPEKGNFAPESVSDDPPIKSAPGEGKQEPNHCGSPPCP